jgi:hypothetical protein
VIRRRFNFARAISLLLSLATVGLWVWSFHAEMHVNYRARAERFSVRFFRGSVGLWGPPFHGIALMEQQAEAWAGLLRNDQVSWGHVVLIEYDEAKLTYPSSIRPGTPSWYVLQVGDVHACIRPLLKALEDPDRLGAAHSLLTVMTAARTIRGRPVVYVSPLGTISLRDHLESDPAIQFDASGHMLPHSILVNCNGLRVELWPDGATANRASYPVELEGDPKRSFRLDASSFDSVRESWHRRLDVRLAFLPAWALPLAVAIYPLALVLRLWRRRAASSRGRCWSCGYNLAGNVSGVCPECGTPVRKKSEVAV